MAICIIFLIFPNHLLCTVTTTQNCFLLTKKAKKDNLLMPIHPLYLLVLLSAGKYPREKKKDHCQQTWIFLVHSIQ